MSPAPDTPQASPPSEDAGGRPRLGLQETRQVGPPQGTRLGGIWTAGELSEWEGASHALPDSLPHSSGHGARRREAQSGPGRSCEEPHAGPPTPSRAEDPRGASCCSSAEMRGSMQRPSGGFCGSNGPVGGGGPRAPRARSRLSLRRELVLFLRRGLPPAALGKGPPGHRRRRHCGRCRATRAMTSLEPEVGGSTSTRPCGPAAGRSGGKGTLILPHSGLAQSHGHRIHTLGNEASRVLEFESLRKKRDKGLLKKIHN